MVAALIKYVKPKVGPLLFRNKVESIRYPRYMASIAGALLLLRYIANKYTNE